MLWRWLTGLILLVMASTAQATPNYNGYHNVADCSSISGWAWDANKRTQPINVDIYDGSTLISTLPAATFDQGLLNWGFGDGRHAFSIATPASLLDGKWHLITVKYGGTQTNLNSTPIALSCIAPGVATPNYNGYHNVADCSSISGWAWDANKRTQPINVDIYDGSTLISTLPAATFDQGLLNWGFGDGRHAFSIATPASLLDGKWHLITVKYGGTQTALNNSPRAINACTAAAQAKVYYIHADQLDTPRVITDTAGNVVWQWDNVDPFGNNMANENPSGLGAFKFDLRFPGQVADRETNTFYNTYRDAYDSASGRYTQFDPIGLRGGINGYVYVLNNPLRYTDPTGLLVPLVIPGICAAGGCEAIIVAGGIMMSTPGGKAIKSIAQKIKELCTPDDKDPCDEQQELEEAAAVNTLVTGRMVAA